MTIEPTSPFAPRPGPRRLRDAAASGLILVLAGPGLAGCARDRGAITPTTTGTDLSRLPRGRMTPQPFPGSSLADRDVAGPGRAAEGRTPPGGPILTAGSSDAVIR